MKGSLSRLNRNGISLNSVAEVRLDSIVLNRKRLNSPSDPRRSLEVATSGIGGALRANTVAAKAATWECPIELIAANTAIPLIDGFSYMQEVHRNLLAPSVSILQVLPAAQDNAVRKAIQIVRTAS